MGNVGIGDFGNKMEVSYSGNNITIQDGLACVRGKFIEEDSSTTLSIGTDNSFCKLVLEVDLSKTNTEEQLNQVSYKVVKSTNNYPSLTQTDIVKNRTGIYQYELARFKTSTNGITDFQDMRTFIDFNSIYAAIETEYRAVLEELRVELTNVKNGSAYVLQDKFKIVEAYASSAGNLTINYPEGFDKACTVVIGIKRKQDIQENWTGVYGIDNTYIQFFDDCIMLNNAIAKTNYQIALMFTGPLG